jgi:transcriptional regulator with XRE-family HTH domain
MRLIRHVMDPQLTRKKKVLSPVMGDRATENKKLALIIGSRFIEARELNGFVQAQAALLIGWKNSTQLSLIEQGKRIPPPTLLKFASKVFGVSIDFLMGESNEPERDPKRAERDAAMRQVRHIFEGQADYTTSLVLQYITNGTPSVSTSRRLMACATHLVATVNRVRELNPKAFDEKLKGGSKLIGSVVEMEEAIQDVRMMLEKHDRFIEVGLKNADEKAGVTRPLFESIADLPGVDMDAIYKGRK